MMNGPQYKDLRPGDTFVSCKNRQGHPESGLKWYMVVAVYEFVSSCNDNLVAIDVICNGRFMLLVRPASEQVPKAGFKRAKN